jgi:hypothetical protein
LSWPPWKTAVVVLAHLGRVDLVALEDCRNIRWLEKKFAVMIKVIYHYFKFLTYANPKASLMTSTACSLHGRISTASIIEYSSSRTLQKPVIMNISDKIKTQLTPTLFLFAQQ